MFILHKGHWVSMRIPTHMERKTWQMLSRFFDAHLWSFR